MTDKDLNAMIAELKELDAKRTHGASMDWVNTGGNVWTDDRNGYGEQQQVLLAQSNEFDAEFIAAAPRMMQIITRLQADIAALKDESVKKRAKISKKHPYMIFVEGEKMPTAEQPSFEAGFRETKRLREKFPDRTILLMRLSQRYKPLPPEAKE